MRLEKKRKEKTWQENKRENREKEVFKLNGTQMIDWNSFTWRCAADNMDRLQSLIGCLETCFWENWVALAVRLNLMSSNDLIGHYILATFYSILHWLQYKSRIKRIEEDRERKKTLRLTGTRTAAYWAGSRAMLAELFPIIRLIWLRWNDVSLEWDWNERLPIWPLREKINCKRLKTNNHLMHLPIISCARWNYGRFDVLQESEIYFHRHQYWCDSLK